MVYDKVIIREMSKEFPFGKKQMKNKGEKLILSSLRLRRGFQFPHVI